MCADTCVSADMIVSITVVLTSLAWIVERASFKRVWLSVTRAGCDARIGRCISVVVCAEHSYRESESWSELRFCHDISSDICWRSACDRGAATQKVLTATLTARSCYSGPVISSCARSRHVEV